MSKGKTGGGCTVTTQAHSTSSSCCRLS